MEVVYLFAGLGNQMFQYAFYLLKKKQGRRVCCESSILWHKNNGHYGYELGKAFAIKKKSNCFRSIFCFFLWYVYAYKRVFLFTYLVRIFQYFNISIISEKIGNVYDESYLYNVKGFVCYQGFWQNKRYYEQVQDELKKDFSFNEKALSFETLNMASEIKKENSVSIHIRRGDFLLPGNMETHAGVCTETYYRKALDIIKNKVKDPKFYIFTDDYEWAMKNFLLPNSTIVNINKDNDSWQDMYLMSICKHNIIANSTFSWWAAWLNKNIEKIVIAPSKFFNNELRTEIIPENWIAIL